jgi:hypothetical protein
VKIRTTRTFLLFLFATLVAIASAAQCLAQRPTAPRLLPPDTLAMARVADGQELVQRFRQTALGRITDDEQIRPLTNQLYGSLRETFKQIEGRVGLSLDELMAIPQGEICAAFAALPDQPPGLIVLLDARDRAFQVRKLLENEDRLRESGVSKTTEKIGPDDVAVVRLSNGFQLFVLEREGTFCATTTKELMQFVLNAWDGNAGESLADRANFNTIMSRCASGGDGQPQITWFVDPIEGVKRLARGSFAATGLALLPVLGLNGIQGAGGSITFAAGEFDEVQHMHLLLDNPRTGVLEAVALTSGDSTPEAWVPPDCITYSTIHWNLNQTFRVSSKLYNSLMGDQALEEEIRTRISTPLGADFEKEILPALAGRATLVQWVEKPIRINSVTTLVGVRLKNPDALKPALDKVLQKYADRVEKQRYGVVNYWSIRVPRPPMRENAPPLRQQQPCVGIVGDYLLMTDSLLAFQEAVVTASDPSRGLANSLDFKLIASKIKRQPGGDAPGAIQFSRPEEGMRFWYDLALSEETKRRLESADNNFFRSVDQALKDHPLPPFEVLAQYLAPGGGMIVNDDTGIHYSTFTLKRK